MQAQQEDSTQNQKEVPMIITPYQIFCFQNRAMTSRMNPSLKGTSITSILAKAWKALSNEKKQHFEELSMTLRTTNTENVFIKPQVFKPVPEKSEEKKTKLYIPQLRIIPRRTFGIGASEASQAIYDNLPSKRV